MRKYVHRLVLACAAILVAGSAQADHRISPRYDIEALEAWLCLDCDSGGWQREQLTEDLAHYRIDLTVGPGAFDRIVLHRVTAERAPGRPLRRQPGVFLAHGIVFGFRGTFLSSTAFGGVDDSRSLAVFLARRGYDVWGLDFRWPNVPADTPNLEFIDSWGIQQDADDLGLALTAARVSRLLSGNGLAPVHLLGYSRGGRTGYAYLNAESQLPRPLRQVAGFIPLDAVFKAGTPELRERACENAATIEDALAAGTYVDDFSFLPLAGTLAAEDPDGPSPLFPGLSNRQASLIIGARPSETGFHLVGGTFGANGLPTGLRFTEEAYWNSFLGGAGAFQPLRGSLDASRIACDEEDVPWDDHLADVRVPVFYVGAEGGNRETAAFTTTLLGSDDVETLVISQLPPGQNAFDFGHLDVLTGTDAEELVWEPILNWLRRHPARR